MMNQTQFTDFAANVLKDHTVRVDNYVGKNMGTHTEAAALAKVVFSTKDDVFLNCTRIGADGLAGLIRVRKNDDGTASFGMFSQGVEFLRPTSD